MSCPTLTIKCPKTAGNPKGELVINAADFDPQRHELADRPSDEAIAVVEARLKAPAPAPAEAAPSMATQTLLVKCAPTPGNPAGELRINASDYDPAVHVTVEAHQASLQAAQDAALAKEAEAAKQKAADEEAAKQKADEDKKKAAPKAAEPEKAPEGQPAPEASSAPETSKADGNAPAPGAGRKPRTEK